MQWISSRKKKIRKIIKILTRIIKRKIGNIEIPESFAKEIANGNPTLSSVIGAIVNRIA